MNSHELQIIYADKIRLSLEKGKGNSAKSGNFYDFAVLPWHYEAFMVQLTGFSENPVENVIVSEKMKAHKAQNERM